MKKYIRNSIKRAYKSYLFYNSTKAFEKRYTNVDKNLFKNTLDKNVIKEYKKKWNVFGKKVEVDTFLLCYNLSGKIDYNIIPENIFAAIIEPALNSYKELSFFQVKNVYEKWFSGTNVFPKSYLHKIDGIYYNRNFQPISNIDTYINEAEIEYPLILKPSRETSGGAGITKINNLDELKENLNNWNDIVCQEMIKQHDNLNNINPGINSVRTCLYRAKDGKYKVINNSIRFGLNGSMDNETAGGIVCNINNNGSLNEYAVNKYATKYLSHPNSKVAFKDIILPYYGKLIETTEKIANKVPLSNLLSLDMALDKENNWRCLEINTFGQTIRFVQYAGKGFFGEYTDEVINKFK